MLGTTGHAANAATTPVTVNGAPLDGSTQQNGNFLVTVDAPVGVKVKFKLDGTYLGQARTSPYMWQVTAGLGKHRFEARWDSGGRQEFKSQFVVSGGATATPVPVAPQPAPTPVTPVPAPAPPVTPPSAGGTTTVADAAQLTAALRAARPGSTIALRDGTYIGKFTASVSGTASAPIILPGSRKAILSTGKVSSGYGLHITGSHWRVTGISVTNSAKGIVLDASMSTILAGVDVGNIGTEAVHFRTGSSDGAIVDSVIHDTGLTTPAYGEGIYVGSAKSNRNSIMGSSSVRDASDRVLIKNNRISNTSAEGIDIKEGTTGGVVVGNTFTRAGYSGANSADFWVDVKGNGYRVEGNSGSTARLDAFQVHSVLAGWGNGNTFAANTVQGVVPGYAVWVQSNTTATS